MKDPLQAAALAVSSAKGDQVFQELTRYLATILGVRLALIGRVTDKFPRSVRTLGIYGRNGYGENIEYPLDITPCRNVMRGSFAIVPRNVLKLFPEDHYLPRDAEGYAGYPLLDGAAHPAGVIAVITREPIADPGVIESVLKIFAVRAAAELERRTHIEALAASEASYRGIFEASEDAIFLHDYESGAILDVNPKACSTYGYSREELKRLSVGDLSGNVAPYTNEEALRLIREVRAGGGPLRFEWRRRNKDGSLHWDEVTLKKVDIAGRPHVMAMTRQITERKSAVEALKASEEQYRAIFNASADSLVLRDAEFRVVDVNPAYEKMSGRSRGEALGRSGLTMSPPELTEHVKGLHARALAGEQVVFEALARRKDGSRFNIETRGVPILHQGRPHVLYIGRDITAKKSEEELLRASEEQYRAIFDASADALVLWDEHMRRVDVNSAYQDVFGFTKAEVLAPGYDEAVRPVQYAERRRELIARTLRGERCHVEIESVHKDGSAIHIEVRTIPIQYRGRPHVLSISRDVTERRRAEAAMRASEEQYRAIFNASVDGMLLWDADHRIVDVNESFLRMHGYGRDEVVGKREPLFMPAAARATCGELLPRVIAGEACRIESLALRKDGTEFEVEIHGVPMEYQGRPHVLVILRDLTLRRQAEERLRASEERYRRLFEMESDAMVLVDVDTLQHVDVNPAAVELYGYTREELLTLKSTDLSAEEHQTRSAMQTGAMEGMGKGAVRVPLRYHRKRDGTVFPVEITANFFQLNGRSMMLAAIRDISERQRAEAAVRASEERYRLLFEMDSDAILLVDAESLDIIDLNPVAGTLWGYSREELLRMRATELSVEQEQTRAAVQQGVGTITIPLRWHRKKDGTVFPIEITANRFELEGRKIVLAAIRDISQRQRAEAERAQLEAQLRQAQKMEAIGQLAGGIAHDFNNILQSILGNLTLSAERAEDLEDAKLARYVERAQLSAQRARELIQQMLTFSRGRRGEPRVMALAPLVGEAAKLLRPMLPSTIEVRTQFADEAPHVKVDRVQAEQVLLNLCINARDAMRGQGTIALGVRGVEASSICTACRQRFSGRFGELEVRDTGPGIAPEVVDRMFEPFFSTKEVGSGMGLSMVHGIVHEHGGHVVVETAPGEGARFRVLLPASDGLVTPEEKKPRAQARPKLAGSVMVVDDENMILEFMGDLLANWGLEVTLKSSGIEAKHAFAAEPQRYDLVLTDHTMPRITGLELARQIRGIRPGTPVILYTGYGEDIAEVELAAAGVRALARKPVEPAELLALLTTHLQQTRNTVK